MFWEIVRFRFIEHVLPTSKEFIIRFKLLLLFLDKVTLLRLEEKDENVVSFGKVFVIVTLFKVTFPLLVTFIL